MSDDRIIHAIAAGVYVTEVNGGLYIPKLRLENPEMVRALGIALERWAYSHENHAAKAVKDQQMADALARLPDEPSWNRRG